MPILVASDNGAEGYADAGCVFLDDVILAAQPTPATTRHRRRVNLVFDVPPRTTYIAQGCFTEALYPSAKATDTLDKQEYTDSRTVGALVPNSVNLDVRRRRISMHLRQTTGIRSVA